jgi:hypothetical protein
MSSQSFQTRHVGYEFFVGYIGSTDLAATTHFGTNLSQVNLLFVFGENPELFLKKEKA